MPRLFPKLVAGFLLIAGHAAPAQIIRLNTPKKSSADAGVNSVQAPSQPRWSTGKGPSSPTNSATSPRFPTPTAGAQNALTESSIPP